MNDLEILTESSCIETLNEIADAVINSESMREDSDAYRDFIMTMSAATLTISSISKRKKFSVAEAMAETLGVSIMSVAVAVGVDPDTLKQRITEEAWTFIHGPMPFSQTVN